MSCADTAAGPRLPFPIPRELSGGTALARWITVGVVVVGVGMVAGAERSLVWTGVATTFWQPLLVFVAAWTPWRPSSPARLAMYSVVGVGAAFVLLVLGQVLVARLDLTALPRFFPVLIVPAALLFETQLQLTMVCERKPFDRFGVRGGVMALLVSVAVAVAGYELLVNWTSFPVAELPPGLRDASGPLLGTSVATWLITLAAWQVIVMVTLNGWPGRACSGTGTRILVNNVVTLGGTSASVFVVEALGVSAPVLSGAMGCIVAGGRLPFVLYDAGTDRRGTLTARVAQTVLWCAVVATVLWTFALSSDFKVQPAGLWVAVTGLNLVSGGTTYAATFVGGLRRERRAPDMVKARN